MSEQRFLISKGFEGFADRLQCLSHCIRMALRHNRILVVDWRDRLWQSGFHEFFELIDVPIVHSVEAIPGELRVYPRFWSGGPGLRVDEWIYKLKGDVALDLGDSAAGDEVWVHPGIGYREYDVDQLVRHLRLTVPVKDRLRERGFESRLPVVHLRGTDRPVPEDRWQLLREVAPVATVVSDDYALVDRWRQESPGSTFVSTPSYSGPVGAHKRDVADRFSYNLDLIREFLIIAAAREAHALNEQSLFFTMGRLFGACGGVARLFA